MKLTENTMKLAIAINTAIERARDTKEMSFISLYHDGKDVHFAEIIGEAASEVRRFIEDWGSNG